MSAVVPPHDGAPPAGDAPAESVSIDQLATVRVRVRDRIAAANATTEVEVLALGSAIRTIVEQAKSYEAEVREQLASVHSDSGIGAALEGQAATFERLSTVLHDRLSHLQERSVEAETLAREIIGIGVQVSEISMASKTLALNARLEAARSADGDSFAVIADEMASLNRAVQASNGEINSIAQRMLRVLPDIRAKAGALQEEAQGYRDELGAHAADVSEGEAVLRRALSQVQHLGDERIARIVAESRAAADHLAFQDPVAQSLMRIDADLHELEAQARGERVEAPLQVELGSALGESEYELDDGEFMFL